MAPANDSYTLKSENTLCKASPFDAWLYLKRVRYIRNPEQTVLGQSQIVWPRGSGSRPLREAAIEWGNALKLCCVTSFGKKRYLSTSVALGRIKGALSQPGNVGEIVQDCNLAGIVWSRAVNDAVQVLLNRDVDAALPRTRHWSRFPPFQ